jgi:hypothetical protein
MTIIIRPGMRVEFDSEHGPQKGTVVGELKDINNGEKYAVVAIDHALSGCVWQVPASNLQPEHATA